MEVKNMNKKLFVFLALIFILTISLSTAAYAQEDFFDDDIMVFGLELEKLLNFGAGLLALVLLYLTAVAYKRTGKKRLLYVSAAFGIFAVKGFLTAHELFFEEWEFVDPIASLLSFAVMICFFMGLIKK